MARTRRPHAPALARARGGRVLRGVLLRFGDALLSRSRRVGPRRPDADAARAGALLLLARLGARAAPAAPDRHGRRPGAAAAARPAVPDAVRRRAVRAATALPVVPLPHPSGASGWLNAPGEPRAARGGDGARPRASCATSTLRSSERRSRTAAPSARLALLPPPVQARRSRSRSCSRSARRRRRSRSSG